MQAGFAWTGGVTAEADGRLQLSAAPPWPQRTPHACLAKKHAQVVHLPVVHLHFTLVSNEWGRGPWRRRSCLKHRRWGGVELLVEPMSKIMSPLPEIRI